MSETAISRLYVMLGMKSTLGEDTQKASGEVKKFEKDILSSSKQVGAAFTAIGGAALLLADNSRKLNADLGQTALQLGLTADEMRTLALETTSITFPLQDTVATFDLLTRAGMRNTEGMQRTANALSDLGTAMGYNASELAESLIPAFNAFGVPLEEVEDHVDTFTHLLRNTTVDLSDYASMVNYLAPQLDTMNLSIEDSVAVMEALADKGIQGGAATREFRKAATAAEGDVKKFYEALGLTAGEVEVYAREIQDATGITKEYAAVAETQFGTIDHLKQAWSELSFQIGSAIEPFEGVAVAATALGGIMMGLGPALQVVTAAKTAYTAATAAATTATTAFAAALLANPVTLVAAGVTALALALGGYYLATRKADEATKDFNRTGMSALEQAKERVKGAEAEIEATKKQIEWHQKMRDEAADLGGLLNHLSAQYHQSYIDEYTEKIETLTGTLEDLKDGVVALEDQEINIEMAESQHNVDKMESSLSRILGLMGEIAGEEKVRAELADTEAIQEIRVRTSQKDLDDAEEALRRWEKGGDNAYALEFGATAAREEHQRLIDEVTKAQVNLNRATRDHEDTLEELNGLTERYNSLNDEMVGAVADIRGEFEDFDLTLGDVAEGMDHVIEKYRTFIAMTSAGQERQRQIDLLLGIVPDAETAVPVVSGGVYGKGLSQSSKVFETTEEGSLRRTPAGDRPTDSPVTTIAAQYAVDPLPAIQVETPDPVTVVAQYAVDPLPAIEVETPDPVTIAAQYAVDPLPAIQVETPDPVTVVAQYAVDPLPAIEVETPDPVTIAAQYAVDPLPAIQVETPDPVTVIAQYAVDPLPAIQVETPDPVTVIAQYAVDSLPAIKVDQPDPVIIEAQYVGDLIGSDILQAESELNEIREIRNRLDSDAVLTTGELRNLYTQIEDQIPEIGAVHGTTVDGMISKLDEYIRRQETAIDYLKMLQGTPEPDDGGLVRQPVGRTAELPAPADPKTIDARYPPPPHMPLFEFSPVPSDVLVSEQELNEIRGIRNELDSGATQITADLLALYERVQEEIPEIGEVHDLTVTGMVGKLDEYIRRQEVAIANMREMSGGGSTVVMTAPGDQPERSAATGMPYVPRDMNVRVHQGEAIVPASETRSPRALHIHMHNPVVRNDADIDILTSALYRRLQRT